jgi:hypothetical protein
VVKAEVQVFFYADENERGQRQNQLHKLAPLLTVTQWLLPPL